MNIGSAIESVRKIKNISQKDLAERAEITQSYLSLIESDKKIPNVKTLNAISAVLDLPTPFLLLFSISENDVPNNKQESFKLVFPLIKSLLSEYVKID